MGVSAHSGRADRPDLLGRQEPVQPQVAYLAECLTAAAPRRTAVYLGRRLHLRRFPDAILVRPAPARCYWGGSGPGAIGKPEVKCCVPGGSGAGSLPAPAQRSPPPETLLQPPCNDLRGETRVVIPKPAGRAERCRCSIRASMPMDAAWNPNLVPTLAMSPIVPNKIDAAEAGSLTAHPERASGSGRHSLCR